MRTFAPSRRLQRRPVVRATVAGCVLVSALAWAGPGAPLGLLVGAGLLVWAASSPRFGLTASVVTALLVPLPLAFRIGSFSLTIGRLVGFAFLIGWLASLSRPDGPVVRRTGFEVGMFAFALAALVSLLVNSSHLDNGTVTSSIRGLLVLVVDYFAFFYAAVSVLRAARHHLDRVLRIVSGLVVFMSGLGLIEKLTGRNVFAYVAPGLPGSAKAYVASLAANATQVRGGQLRIQSTTEGPNELGAVLVMTLPLILHYSAQARTPARRLAWMASALLCLVAGIFTESRSVLIGFGLDLAVYGLCMLRSHLSLRRVLAILAASAAAFFIFPHARASVLGAVTTAVQGHDTSVSGRQFQANAIVQIFEHSPAFGQGPETLSENALIKSGATVHITTDNYYLATLGEEGLFGLLGLVIIIGGSLMVGIRLVRTRLSASDRSLASALLAAMAGWALLTYLFDSLAFYAPSKLWLLLLAALVAMGSMDFRGQTEPSVAVLDIGWPIFVLRRNRRMVRRIVLAGAVGSLVLVGMLHPASKGTAVVEIDQPRSMADPATGLKTFAKGRELMATYAEMAVSDSVLAQVAKATQWSKSVGALRDEVVVTAETGTLLLQVTVTDPSPVRALTLSNSVATIFASDTTTTGVGEGQIGTVLRSAQLSSSNHRTLDALIVVLGSLAVAVVAAFWREYQANRLLVSVIAPRGSWI